MDPFDVMMRRVRVFDGLDAEARERLRAHVERVEFAPEDVILREGEPADAAWVILEGDVQIFRTRPDGLLRVLNKLRAGAVFGEQGLLSRLPRNANARAHTAVVALRIPGGDFQAALKPDQPLRGHLLSIGEEQRRANLARESAVLQTLPYDGGPGEGVRERAFADGEVLFHEGDEAHHLFVILSGRAAVYQSSAAGPVLVRRLLEGQTIGELALLRRTRRAGTVVADGPLRTYEIDAARFAEMQRSSPELRDHLQTVERVYALPRRGFITQYAGRFLHREAVNTVYDLDGGQRLIASHVVGEDLCNLERVPPRGSLPGEVRPVRFADAARGVDRELRLTGEGDICGVTVYGEWPDLMDLYTLAIEGRRLAPAQVEAFRRTGSIGPALRPADAAAADERIVCACVNVRKEDLHRAVRSGLSTIEALQRETRCGTVCGGCLPVVREFLGGPGWTPVLVQEEIPVCDGIRTFRLKPVGGAVAPSLPGQHVVIQAEINGSWVQRPYTLSSGGTGSDCYEVTIQREQQGLFSRWMFDQRLPDSALRVSRPQGEYYWQPGECDVVCLVAGIGLTPALAICRTMVEQNSARSLWIDYSARHAWDFAYAAELTAAASARPQIHVNLRETARHGRLGADQVRLLAERFPAAQFFLCGPGEYLESMSAHLTSAGVPRERIRIEVFAHVGDPPQRPAPQCPAPPPPRAARRRPPGESTLFVDPAPDPPRPPPPRVVQWLAELGERYRFELLVAGRRINPVEAAADVLEARLSGRDVRVPAEYLAIPRRATMGVLTHQLAAFERYAATLGPNRQRAIEARRRGAPLPAHTPDGETWTFTVPSISLLQFQGPNATDTGWKRLAETPLSPVYVTRSRTALRNLLCDARNVDRGAVPNHYWQQLIGYPGVKPSADCKPAGVLIGQYRDNCLWRRDRALVQDQIGPAAMDGQGAAMARTIARVCDEEIDPFVDRHPGRVVDASVMMGQIALRMIMVTAFGGIDEDEGVRLGTQIMAIVRRTMQQMAEFHLGKLQRKAEFEREVASMRALTLEMIAVLREAHARGSFTPQQLASPLMQHMLFAGDRGTSGTPEDTLAGPVLPLIVVAGHETTAASLTWALYEMGRDPDLLRTIVAESDAFRQAHGERPVTVQHYDERPCMLALLFEIGRRYPPLPQIVRSATEAGSVPPDPETGIGAFDYPKDASLVLSLLGANMDPECYPQPTAFRIERFLEGTTPQMSQRERGRRVRDNARRLEEQFRLVPFAAGDGACPGRGLNMLEFFLVLDALLQRYVIELEHPERVVGMNEYAVISGPTPGEIGVRLRRRGAAATR